MPIIGLGTWNSAPGEVYDAVTSAIQNGYRHIDCATVYGNEAEVGQALEDMIKAGVVSREELWITSKLWNNAHRPAHVKNACEKSLSDLRLDYLDLYLIHWPVLVKPGLMFQKTGHDLEPLEDVPIATTWPAMEKLYKRGLCKHIGVSNFSIVKLKSLLEHCSIAPEMNQIEMHPYLQQPEMVNFCHANNIHLTAYAPLGSANRPDRLKVENEPVLMEDPLIGEIAKRHNVSPAQILLSWSAHRNVAVIPKSVKPERLKQNLAAAEISLSEQELSDIEGLDLHRRYISGTFWTMEGSPYTLESLWDE